MCVGWASWLFRLVFVAWMTRLLGCFGGSGCVGVQTEVLELGRLVIGLRWRVSDGQKIGILDVWSRDFFTCGELS